MKRGTDLKLKFKKLRVALRLQLWQTKGLLQALWDFTAESAIEGDIGRYADEEIAIGIDYRRDPTKLVEALSSSGWIDRGAPGRLTVHHWHEHCEDWIWRRVCRQAWAGGSWFASDPDGHWLPPPGKYERRRYSSDNDGQRPTTTDNVRPKSDNDRLPEPVPEPVPEPSQEEGCSEPPAASEPPGDVFLSFPVKPARRGGSAEWHLTEAKLAEYATSFPGLDVRGCCRHARQWCIDNPAKQKTARGMPAFLSRWLAKDNDRGVGIMPPEDTEAATRLPDVLCPECEAPVLSRWRREGGEIVASDSRRDGKCPRCETPLPDEVLLPKGKR